MKSTAIRLSAFMLSAIIFLSFNKSYAMDPIKEESVSYTSGGINFRGFIAFDQAKTGKRPAVLVIPEWWGLNEYAKSRARQLAGLGYFAMAVDMYGEGKTANNPQEAMALTRPFYSDPQLSMVRIEAALAKLRTFDQVDARQLAAIGYCFGGNAVLNAARLGADLKGVVSFHGGLGGASADKNLLKAKILVCNGGNDKSVTPENIASFTHAMDSIGADYIFRTYPGATHAFTNPDATRVGKEFGLPIEYNPEADHASWKDMKEFLEKLFAE